MRKIVIPALFVLSCGAAYSQVFVDNFRFGFQVSPTISWMSTDNNKINSNGVNIGIKIGMVGEYYFGTSGNYALISGIGFAFNQGGTLKHEVGGNFWPEAELTSSKFNTGLKPLPDGVNMKYNLRYVEIPIGFKMRTNDFGNIRYFAEIPLFNIGMLTQARGAINGTGVNTDNENIKGATNFFNITWGFGGGVEYSVSEKTALVGGLYYQQGFTDVTRDKNAFKRVSETGPSEPESSKGTLGAIVLRLGVIF